MKKTILATLVGFMAVGAHATEVAPTADVYGQVGVAIDARDSGNAGTDVTDINATRNTEFGVRGDAAISQAFNAEYDLRVGFSGDNEAELTRANVKVAHDKFFVAAGIAESSFDNATANMDVFDSTFTGEFEVFDAVRAGERVTLGVTPVGGLDVAVDFAGNVEDGQDLGDRIELGAKYQVKGFDFGLGYVADTNVDGDADLEITSTKIGAGYDFAHVGVDGLYLGAVYGTTELVDGTFKEDGSIASVTGSYELGYGVTFAGGYAVTDVDAEENINTLRLGVDYAAAKNVTVKAGYAVHSSDLDGAEDESMLTAGVIYNF